MQRCSRRGSTSAASGSSCSAAILYPARMRCGEMSEGRRLPPPGRPTRRIAPRALLLLNWRTIISSGCSELPSATRARAVRPRVAAADHRVAIQTREPPPCERFVTQVTAYPAQFAARGYRPLSIRFATVVQSTLSAPAADADARHEEPMSQTETGVKLNFATDWTYAPAPETAKVQTSSHAYDLFIDGRLARRPRVQYFDTINPANEKKLPEVASATTRGRRRAVKARAHARTTKSGRRCPARSAASTSTASPACSRNAPASSSIIESMDGGKPIRESRDVDVPLARRALLLLRRLGGQARSTRSPAKRRAARRRGAGHPVELPAADGGVEDRAGAGDAATPSCSSPPRPRRSPR